MTLAFGVGSLTTLDMMILGGIVLVPVVIGLTVWAIAYAIRRGWEAGGPRKPDKP